MTVFELKVYCTHTDLEHNVECELIEETESGYCLECPECKREIFVELGKKEIK